MLKVQACHLQTMEKHGEKTYPHECCGLLLGHFEDNMAILTEVYATENVWSPEIASELPNLTDSPQKKTLSTKNRFAIAPKTLLQVQKEARERRLTIIGVYHSHPDHPAIPSLADQAIAWQEYLYLIVSVQQGKAVDIRCWKLDENHQFQPVNYEL